MMPQGEASGALPMRFCWMAAVPRENWGMVQTILAMMVATSQDQPRSGWRWLLMSWRGRFSVERVT